MNELWRNHSSKRMPSFAMTRWASSTTQSIPIFAKIFPCSSSESERYLSPSRCLICAARSFT